MAFQVLGVLGPFYSEVRLPRSFVMKMKTKKAAAKRFSFTATGKVKFKRTNKRHNMGNKSSARKLKLRKAGILFEGDVKHIEKCLPYGV
jgi:large subunit ribosomal protein L35